MQKHESVPSSAIRLQLQRNALTAHTQFIRKYIYIYSQFDILSRFSSNQERIVRDIEIDYLNSSMDLLFASDTYREFAWRALVK